MIRAQVALEFIIYTMIGVFLVLILIGLAGRLTVQEMDAQAAADAEDLALTLQQELITAAEAREGYHRVLNIPLKLRAHDYDISNDEHSLTITRNGNTISLRTPPLNGTFAKGRNVIRNEAGSITIEN